MSYLETNRFYPNVSQPQRKEIGSAAFSLEYRQNIPPQSLRDDIVSYLGEYRFKLQKYDYELLFGMGENGFKLRDVNDNEAMTTKAQRAIERRLNKNKNISREQAELEGLIFLEKQLLSASNGNQVIWVSPPGPPEDGYGDYAFVYDGIIKNGRIKMSAIRIEHPTIAQFNYLVEDATGEKIEFGKAEDFLAHPFILDSKSVNIESILGKIFNFQPEEKQLKTFSDSINKISPYIEKFISMVREDYSKEELLRMFHSIENYAIDLINNLSLRIRSNSFDRHFPVAIPIDKFIRQYGGYKPPVATGSCGSSESKNKDPLRLKSNRLFSGGSVLKGILDPDDEEEWGYKYYPDKSCRFCSSHNLGPCQICKSCTEKINQGKTLIPKN